MPQIERSALVPYAAAKVFDIIMDLERYPDFLPWCDAAQLISAEPDAVVATLQVSAKGLSESFTTRNRARPHDQIALELVSGPFKNFAGLWQLQALGEGTAAVGCKVTLSLDFEFAGPLRLLGRPLANRLGKVADKILDAFCQRAAQLEVG